MAIFLARTDSSGKEDGICSGSVLAGCAALLALAFSAACAWSASLAILVKVALVLLEGGFKRVVPISSGANAPLMVNSCGIASLPLGPVRFATTRPSLSSLPCVMRPEDAGENMFFGLCAVDAGWATRTRTIGAEGATFERFGRGIRQD